MCGILGILSFDGRAPDGLVVVRMGETMLHRGPDEYGVYAHGPAALGHRRLSIIDLGYGRQPIFNERGDVAVVFNGEIYNYVGIREMLLRKGHVFRTQSDTEVIIHLYEEHGIDCLRYLEGMFAFAIWDGTRNMMFIGRDRFGIKPVVYYQDEHNFIFASEIKALLEHGAVARRLDLDALSCYLCLNYIPAPYTIYRDIKKLAPGHYITVEFRGEDAPAVNMRGYYDLARVSHGVEPIEEIGEAKHRLRSALEESVWGHMISDVPLGAFLSGGIDSSIVVGLMARLSDQRIRTFSIGYEGHDLFDETDYAREVARFNGTEHHEFKLSCKDVQDIIPSVLDGLDEPFSDWSIFPTFLVCRETRNHVKVALSGDGADEVFGGYRKYLGEIIAKYYLMLPLVLRKKLLEPMLVYLPDSYDNALLERVRRAKRFISGISEQPAQRHFGWMRIFSKEHRERLMNSKVEESCVSPQKMIRELYDRYPGDALNRMLYTDVMFLLPYDMLVKVDLMSMMNSLEVRVPFLDHRVVELAFSFQGSLKLKGLRRKYVLVEAFKDVLPRRLHSRPKQGFDVPIGEWFKGDLRNMFWSVVDQESVVKAGLFDYGFIREMYELHTSGRRDLSKQLLSIFVFQWWLKNNAPDM